MCEPCEHMCVYLDKRGRCGPFVLKGSSPWKWPISHCHCARRGWGRWYWGGDKPGLPRILIVRDDPHSCCTPSVNTDSPIHHRTPFCSTRPKYSNDLVPAAGTALHFSKTLAFKNEAVEVERRQGLQGGEN